MNSESPTKKPGILHPTNPHAWWRYGLVVLALMALFYFLVHTCFPQLAESGTFGDTFGAINAFFTGLAFAGFLIALALQRKDLQNQQAELALQREELKLQREEMAETREVFQFQRNDALLSTLLSNFQRYTDSIIPTLEPLECVRWISSKPPETAFKSKFGTLKEYLGYLCDALDEYKTAYASAQKDGRFSDISLLFGSPSEVAKSMADKLGLLDKFDFIRNFIDARFKLEDDRNFYTNLFLQSIPLEAKSMWETINSRNNETALPIAKVDSLNLENLVNISAKKGNQIGLRITPSPDWEFESDVFTVIREPNPNSAHSIYHPLHRHSITNSTFDLIYLPNQQIEHLFNSLRIPFSGAAMISSLNFQTSIVLRNKLNTSKFNLCIEGTVWFNIVEGQVVLKPISSKSTTYSWDRRENEGSR